MEIFVCDRHHFHFFWVEQEGVLRVTFGRVKSIKLYNRNPDVESFQLVYAWVRSVEGGGLPPQGVSEFWGGLQKIYWAISRKSKIYHQNPQLKPSPLAPFWCKLDKGGGLCAWHKSRLGAHRCEPQGV